MRETGTLEIHICDERRGYRATFSDEDQAIAFLERKHDRNHTWWELNDQPLPRTWEKLLAYLYPTCHHGMSADLCMDPIGPHHFGTREWEIAQYGSW